MIEFFSENNFVLQNEIKVGAWLSDLITSEEYVLGDISFVFCDDTFLHSINLEFLNHDTLTDIITFDYRLGVELHGEIYISTERVDDNSLKLSVDPVEELRRVMAHGVLHLCGYKDKTSKDADLMRTKENQALEVYLDN